MPQFAPFKSHATVLASRKASATSSHPALFTIRGDQSHRAACIKSLTRIVQARRYQQEAYCAFESVSQILLPSGGTALVAA